MPEATILPATIIGMFHEETSVYVVASVTKSQDDKWTDATISPALLSEGYERAAALLRWPLAAPFPSTETCTQFTADATGHGFTLSSVNYVVLARGSELRAFYLNVDLDSVRRISMLSLPNPSSRLDEAHGSLQDRSVAIVGCGSVGSKIATMLARAGVTNFLLVDDDILLPENLVRNDLDWREIGTHKVDSVARRIQLVNPSANCKKRRHRLGGQEASGGIEALIEGLASCDLLVDATADASVFNYLCATVAIAAKPLVWAEVFAGGRAGLVARHRPGFEPGPASMRRAIENWCYEKGKPVEPAANDYGMRGSTAPLIADDADVTVIAAHAARMAIDILIPRNPSIFPNSIYLIGLAEYWIFSRPFETYPVEVGPADLPKEEQDITTDENAAELQRLVRLFENFKNAASRTAENNPPSHQ